MCPGVAHCKASSLEARAALYTLYSNMGDHVSLHCEALPFIQEADPAPPCLEDFVPLRAMEFSETQRIVSHAVACASVLTNQ